jgi:hypothetical protein
MVAALAPLAVFTVIPHAHAVSILWSAPVPAQTGEVTVCNVTSVATKAQKIVVDIQDGNGASVDGVICNGVPPGGECLAVHVPAETGPVHCRITAEKGKKTIRGTMHNRSTGNSSDAR